MSVVNVCGLQVGGHINISFLGRPKLKLEVVGDIKESISPNDICKDLPRMVGQRNFSNITISNAVRYLK